MNDPIEKGMVTEMNMADIMITAAIAIPAAAVVINKIRRIRKKGLGCGCGSCNAAGCTRRRKDL